MVALTLAGMHAASPLGPGAAGMESRAPLALWHRWDALWYLRIVREGYAVTPGAQSDVAFFPLYPLLVRALTALGIPTLAATLVVAHASTLLALAGVHALASRLVGEAAARRALVALLVFPTAIFLSCAYSEATYLALAAWALVACEDDRPWRASALAALAVLCRPTGLTLAAALALAPALRRDWHRAAVHAALPALAFAGWCGYLAARFSDPLAFVHARAAWLGAEPALWRVLHFVRDACGFGPGLDYLAAPWQTRLDCLAIALLLGAGALAWRRFGAVHGLATAGIAVLVLAGGQVLGLSRFCLGAPPLFALLGAWTPRKPIAALATAASLALCALDAWRYVNGAWAG